MIRHSGEHIHMIGIGGAGMSPIAELLRALGYDEENAPGFLDRFVAHFDFLEGQWEKERDLAPTQDEALIEIYKRLRPGEPPTVESARSLLEGLFFNPQRYDLAKVGRFKLNKKLGVGKELGDSVLGLDDLDEESLMTILTDTKNALTKQYKKLFDMEGVELEFRDDALRAVAKKAMERKTGARGLRTILENVLLDTMYDLPSASSAKKVVVDEAVVTGENKPYVIYENDEPPTVNVEQQERPTGSDR